MACSPQPPATTSTLPPEQAHSQALVLVLAAQILALPLRADTPPDIPELPELRIRAPALRNQDARLRAGTPLLSSGSCPLLQLRPQGIGAQADMTVQGSSFSGAGISLNGLALQSPQTAHFNAELPLPWDLFDQPETVTGLTQAASGAGHLVGSTALHFAPPTPGGRLSLGGGTHANHWQDLYWDRPLLERGTVRTSLSVFGTREEADGSAIRRNGVEAWRTGTRLHLQHTQWGEVNVAVGHQSKSFGAQGFYGAPAHLPSFEELRDTLAVATWRRGTDENHAQLTAVARETVDDYLLDRVRPHLYRNHHISRTAAVHASGRLSLSSHWSAHWNASAQSERLNSEYHGSIVSHPLGRHRRSRADAMLLPTFTRGHWSLSGGLRLALFANEGPALLKLAGAEYATDTGPVAFCTFSETVRQPSFTELNYESPSSLGNQGLERQEAATWELGCRQGERARRQWRITTFHRKEQNAVDWIRPPGGTRWIATGLSTVRVLGIGASTDLWRTSRLRVSAGGEHVRKAWSDDPYAGRYVLDYPRFQAGVAATWVLSRACELAYTQRVVRQRSNPFRTGGSTGLDASLHVRVAFGERVPLQAALSVENLWNDHFQPLPGQPAPGRRVSLALTYSW